MELRLPSGLTRRLGSGRIVDQLGWAQMALMGNARMLVSQCANEVLPPPQTALMGDIWEEIRGLSPPLIYYSI